MYDKSLLLPLDRKSYTGLVMRRRFKITSEWGILPGAITIIYVLLLWRYHQWRSQGHLIRGGGKKLREVRKMGGPEMRKFFRATPFRTSENVPFWKDTMKNGKVLVLDYLGRKLRQAQDVIFYVLSERSCMWRRLEGFWRIRSWPSNKSISRSSLYQSTVFWIFSKASGQFKRSGPR